jgi:hypothetical protein
MQLVYLQFDSLSHLKKFTRKFPLKKVFILLDQQVLLAQLSEKEISFAVEEYNAAVINTPVACK